MPCRIGLDRSGGFFTFYFLNAITTSMFYVWFIHGCIKLNQSPLSNLVTMNGSSHGCNRCGSAFILEWNSEDREIRCCLWRWCLLSSTMELRMLDCWIKSMQLRALRGRILSWTSYADTLYLQGNISPSQ